MRFHDRIYGLHHYKTPAHSAPFIQAFISKHYISYYLSWLPVIFGYFPSLNCHYKGNYLSKEKTTYRMRRHVYSPCQTLWSRSVHCFLEWLDAGRNVCITKEITLKGISISDFKIKKDFFCRPQVSILFEHTSYLGSPSNSLLKELQYVSCKNNICIREWFWLNARIVDLMIVEYPFEKSELLMSKIEPWRWENRICGCGGPCKFVHQI